MKTEFELYVESTKKVYGFEYVEIFYSHDYEKKEIRLRKEKGYIVTGFNEKGELIYQDYLHIY